MKSNKTLQDIINDLDEKRLITTIDKEKLWRSVSSEKNTSFYYWKYWVAASVFLALTISYLFLPQRSEDPQSLTVQNATVDAQTEAEELIETICQSQIALCRSNEFIKLHDQLVMMNHELESIQLMIDQYGDDDQLIESQVRLNIDRTKVTQELINMILS